MDSLSKAYNTLHQRHLRHWLKSGVCEHCRQAARTHWANVSGSYRDEREDYIELCPLCHAKYDDRQFELIVQRRPLPKTKSSARHPVWQDASIIVV